MGNINQLPRKIISSLSDRTPRPRGAVAANLALHQRKGSCSTQGAPDQQPPTQYRKSFLSCKSFSSVSGSFLIPQRCKVRDVHKGSPSNTKALNVQHPVSTSLAAAGEPWVKIQNRRQKTSQCMEFSISKGQSGCRNKFLLVLSYMSLQKNPHFVLTLLTRSTRQPQLPYLTLHGRENT